MPSQYFKRASESTTEDTKALINHLEAYSSTLEDLGFIQNAVASAAEQLRSTIPVCSATG
jgi:hypothetical protein